MPELANGGLVRHRFGAQIDTDKAPHRARIVQRLFHRRIRQVEPVLQKMDPQHPLHSDRRPAGAFALRITRLDHPAQSRPRYDLVHLLEKLLPAGQLAKSFEALFGKAALAHRFNLQTT
jgi:hypothetical protein